MQLYDHAGHRACGYNVNGLTGKEADHKLYAVGTDGRYHLVSDWTLGNADGRLNAKKVYEIQLAVQDGGDIDRSPDAKEMTISILLARG